METYIYKVIYPSGVYVRLTPALTSEKTGEILPYGAVIESERSCMLYLPSDRAIALVRSFGFLFQSF